jgi:hypothetical protein
MSLAAGFCGSAAHTSLMFWKSRMGLLPSFHPYEDLQHMLSHLFGGSVNPWAPSGGTGRFESRRQRASGSFQSENTSRQDSKVYQENGGLLAPESA